MRFGKVKFKEPVGLRILVVSTRLSPNHWVLLVLSKVLTCAELNHGQLFLIAFTAVFTLALVVA